MGAAPRKYRHLNPQSIVKLLQTAVYAFREATAENDRFGWTFHPRRSKDMATTPPHSTACFFSKPRACPACEPFFDSQAARAKYQKNRDTLAALARAANVSEDDLVNFVVAVATAHAVAAPPMDT
jgi:hypothetical protein